MIRLIAEYLGKGVLLGIGIVAVDALYFELYSRERMESVSDELKEGMTSMFDVIYQPGYLRFWEEVEDERPQALLSFNLERAKILDNQIQISGVVMNQGPVVWDLLSLEVEAFDANERIFAECHELMKELGPGESESIIVLCPFAEGIEDPDLSEISFRVNRTWQGDRILPPAPNKVNQAGTP